MLYSLAANYKVIANCQTILESAEADAGAKGFAQTVNAYCLMRVLALTDENGARLNYDGDINVDVATKAEVLDEIVNLLDAAKTNLESGRCFFFYII